MRDVIERHGGTVEKFIGDAVMAVFGIPVVHEDDALRAVRAAAEMREALAALNAELERSGRAHRSGPASTRARWWPAIRHAADDARHRRHRQRRRPARAGGRPGRDPARRARRTAWSATPCDVEAVEPLAAKGKAEPVAGVPARSTVATAGRARARDPTRRWSAASASSAPCTTPSTGGRRPDRPARSRSSAPPGVGKSRLVARVPRRPADGAAVLRGRCLPYGEGITYWPVVEIVREAVAGIAETDDQPPPARGMTPCCRVPRTELDRASRLAPASSASSAESGSPGGALLGAPQARRVARRAAPRRRLSSTTSTGPRPTLLDLIEHIADSSADGGPARRLGASGAPRGAPRRAAAARTPRPSCSSHWATAAGRPDRSLVPGAALPAAARPDRAPRPRATRCYLEELIAMLVDGGFIRPADGERWGSPATTRPHPIPPNDPGASGRTPRPARSGGSRGRRTGLGRRPRIRGPSGEPPLARARASPGGWLPDIAGAQGPHPAGVAAPRR